jgi:hypothetical protein
VKGFPEFGQFYVPDFPGRTQSFKSVASTNFATPARAGGYCERQPTANPLEHVPKKLNDFFDKDML